MLRNGPSLRVRVGGASESTWCAVTLSLLYRPGDRPVIMIAVYLSSARRAAKKTPRRWRSGRCLCWLPLAVKDGGAGQLGLLAAAAAPWRLATFQPLMCRPACRRACQCGARVSNRFVALALLPKIGLRRAHDATALNRCRCALEAAPRLAGAARHGLSVWRHG